MMNLLTEAISWIFVILLFGIILLGRCLSNPLFVLVLAAGIVWFIYAAIHARKLPDEEAESFAQLRRSIRRIFWLVLLACGVIANIFAGPIRFM